VSVITGLLQRLLLYLLLVQLGTMSLGWNMIAWLLHPLLPRHTGTRVGRAAISRIYRIFWATAGRLGMLHIDATALAALRDEPGGLITVELDNGASLRSRTVVLSTGARWRHMGVPGEAEYLNKGVAFCPTLMLLSMMK